MIEMFMSRLLIICLVLYMLYNMLNVIFTSLPPFVLCVLVFATSFAMITSWWAQMGSTLKVDLMVTMVRHRGSYHLWLSTEHFKASVFFFVFRALELFFCVLLYPCNVCFVRGMCDRHASFPLRTSWMTVMVVHYVYCFI